MIMNNKMLLINRNERLWSRKSATLSPFFFGVYCVALHTRAWLDIDIAYSSPVTGGERSVSFWRYVKAWFEADVWYASLRKKPFVEVVGIACFSIQNKLLFRTMSNLPFWEYYSPSCISASGCHFLSPHPHDPYRVLSSRYVITFLTTTFVKSLMIIRQNNGKRRTIRWKHAAHCGKDAENNGIRFRVNNGNQPCASNRVTVYWIS